MNLRSRPPLPLDKQIEQLREEVYVLRQTILNLIPQPLEEALTSYISYPSDEVYKWTEEVIAAVLKHVEPLPINTLEERAYCPLCGDGSSSAYVEGFALPEGLRRHLAGWGSNRCAVMRTMTRQAYVRG